MVLSCGILGGHSLSQGGDRDLVTYTPEGTIAQLEYASKTVVHSTLCVGVVCKDGIVSACVF